MKIITIITTIIHIDALIISIHCSIILRRHQVTKLSKDFMAISLIKIQLLLNMRRVQRPLAINR